MLMELQNAKEARKTTASAADSAGSSWKAGFRASTFHMAAARECAQQPVVDAGPLRNCFPALAPGCYAHSMIRLTGSEAKQSRTEEDDWQGARRGVYCEKVTDRTKC